MARLVTRQVSVVTLFSAFMTVLAVAQTDQRARAADVYQRWVNEDVTYIITSEERTAFLHLTSNSERDQFIVQFWLRRDPTPDTPKNEFKEEHYRRMAYSNEFLADSLPGWKTDRGRVYIIEGPPETILRIRIVPSSHLNAKEHKEQVWLYSPGKKFRFVDTCDCGEYRVVRSPSTE
ncbi:MAG: GWxTD domain-containing protein [Terriglobales bacterium]